MGKTLDTWHRNSLTQKHPHKHGEDYENTTAIAQKKETPPQAWGRPEQQAGDLAQLRNTPTSMGKTCETVNRAEPNQKHPHKHGED